jgi:6-pyruvoyltetrahydropterin/6-carboxytetrahydropterin synthase
MQETQRIYSHQITIKHQEDKPMHTITKSIEFDAAHRLFHHKGQCHNIHGHRYQVLVTVGGEPNSEGMIMDFGLLKKLMMEHIHDPHDHALLINGEDEVIRDFAVKNKFKRVIFPGDPTAELMAERFYWKLVKHFEDVDALLEVTVFETPTSYASYQPEED